MRLFAAFILLSISLNASAQNINELIANGPHTQGIDVRGNALAIQQIRESEARVQLQRMQNEQARFQLQQQQQAVQGNSETDRLQRELLELQIQQERLKLAKLQENDSDLYVSLTSEQVTGESKICLYSNDSALYDFAVPSGDKCPSSIKVRN